MQKENQNRTNRTRKSDRLKYYMCRVLFCVYIFTRTTEPLYSQHILIHMLIDMTEVVCNKKNAHVNCRQCGEDSYS